MLGNVRYIWTSGRKCNFAGCERADLQPPNINGWFWSGSGAKIGPTTQRNSGDWSHTGGFGQPQPDNREAAQVNATIKWSYRTDRHICLLTFDFNLNVRWFYRSTSTNNTILILFCSCFDSLKFFFSCNLFFCRICSFKSIYCTRFFQADK